MPNSKILATDHPQAMDRAITVLRGGGLVALPTDTVYGIAADAWNGKAVSKLYEVKSRSELKSIPVLLSGARAIDQVAVEPLASIKELADFFWPGPLTMVVNRDPELPSEVSASETVGIRAPDHDFTLALLGSYGPLATTSANRSGQPAATNAFQVDAGLGGKVDLILDGGETMEGLASTVVDLTVNPPVLLRQGPISLESILHVWTG